MRNQRSDLPAGVAIGVLACVGIAAAFEPFEGWQTSDIINLFVALGTVATAFAAMLSIRQTSKIQAEQRKTEAGRHTAAQKALALVAIVELEQQVVQGWQSYKDIRYAIDSSEDQYRLMTVEIIRFFGTPARTKGLDRVWPKIGILPVHVIAELARFRGKMDALVERHAPKSMPPEESDELIDYVDGGLEDIKEIVLSAIKTHKVVCQTWNIHATHHPDMLATYAGSLQ